MMEWKSVCGKVCIGCVISVMMVCNGYADQNKRENGNKILVGVMELLLKRAL